MLFFLKLFFQIEGFYVADIMTLISKIFSRLGEMSKSLLSFKGFLEEFVLSKVSLH